MSAKFKYLGIFLGFIAAPASVLHAQPIANGSNPCPSSLNVGFQVVLFGNLKTGIWYPTTSLESPYAYSKAASGSIALHAPPADCERFPLIVFSHGYGGCGTQSVFVTEQLARNGFIVAAPDHSDAGCSVDGSKSAPPGISAAPFSDPAAWTDQTYINRRNDIENVINSVLASPIFESVVDPLRIAGMGHSLGGYTILGMVGGWQSWVDPRIRAALLLSPYCQAFLSKKTLGGVRVPVMYQGGTLDIGITPFVAQSGGVYDGTPPPKYFAELRAAGHLAWTNLTCAQSGAVAQCLAAVANAKVIDAYGFAFLEHYLLSESEALLSSQGPGLANYRHATN